MGAQCDRDYLVRPIILIALAGVNPYRFAIGQFAAANASGIDGLNGERANSTNVAKSDRLSVAYVHSVEVRRSIKFSQN